MDQRKNDSIVPSITQLEDFLTEHNSNVVWLLVATILSCGWIIYLTYYNSRNVGLILTLVLNRLYKHGYIHIGSFSFSVLSGKVMVREIYYITEDMSIRIQDGFIIFRWWKMYNPKQKQHDPKAETRLYITVNDFEFHVYNRSDLYGRLQELFGLEPTIIPPKKDDDKTRENGRTRTQSKIERVKVKTESQDPTSSWRSLIPVIKVNVSTGRLAFGNHYQPQTLCINFDDAFLTYTTKPPSSHLDQFMHIVKGKLENVRVMLVPSPRYVGLQNDEPPRLMGEGFVVLQSNDVDLYYYMDEPGLVPEETEESTEGDISSEDCKLQDLPPCWGLDIVCGKGTDFNYGPWADRQRDCLWKFFFPPDYQVLKVSEIAQPGRPRQILAFELRMNIITDATIDLLFTKNRETNAVHVNVGAGSYLEINIPMTVDENGYTPAIKGQLLHVDATTSMQYRTLLEAEMLAFHINASYPRIWNMPQTWQCELEVYKATYHFIFAQKNFFTDLIQDWSSDNAPDIFSFVPYTWNFKIMFHQFEMIWAANQHNWIDCSTKQQENVYLAACGETLNIDFSLPFTDFVPATCNTRFSLRGEDVDLHLFLPDCHPSKYSLFMLVKNCHPNKMVPETGIPAECQSGQKTVKPKWRNVTQEKAGWVECWTVPSVMLTIDYTWHPIYPQKADEQLKQSLSEMEETMLSVLRPAQKTSERVVSSPSMSPRPPVDPSELPPDKLHVEMELSPDSQITLYGPLLNAFLCIKENYFGEDDMYMDFEEVISSPVLSLSTSSSSGWTAVGMDNDKRENESSAKSIHPLALRPWDITVLVNLYKVHGRLPVHGTTDGPECPTAFLERLCFEMKKGFRETMLQLVLSPLNVFVSDNYQQRPPVDEVLREGHINLSGLQLRAHAMFSAEGLPLGSDSLEYAWLIDVQAGSLTAKVTAPQLACLLEWGQTFVFHVVCREYELERPKSVIVCQHGIDRRFCESKLSCIPGPCPTSDDLKYTMTRLAIDGSDIYIVEHGCATNIKMGAVRIANCNLHNQSVGEGISAAIQDFQVRQYIEQLNNCRIGLQPAVLRRAYWLEAGSANLGLITVDIALAADHHSKHEAQRHFLETHDARTKRLWFLWPDDTLKNKRCRNKCGCLGGCRFFGGTVTGLDFFKLEELTPSSSSAFSSTSAESDMYYGQSLLQPGEWIITKEIPKTVDGNVNSMKRKEWENKSVGIEGERKTQHLSLQVPLRSHSSSSSSEENSSSSAAQPLLAGEKESPSSAADDHSVQKDLLHSARRDDGQASVPTEISGTSPVSPNTQDKSVGQSPLRSPLKRQASVCSTRLGSTKSLTAAFYGDKQPVTVGVQFSSDVSRSDENVLDSPKQRRSFGSFPYTPSADSNSFHQYRSMDSSMSMADSEAYFSAAEEFEPISSDEGPGTYPGRKKKKKQMQQIDYSRGSIYHSVEGPLAVHGEGITDPRTLPFKTHPSQASFVSALGGEDEVIEHVYIVEGEKRGESEQVTSQQPVMSCYHTYLTQFQVINWSVKHPTNKRTSKSSLHRPLDLDTPTSEESSSSFEQLCVPTFKVIKQGLTANSLLDRGMQLSGSTSNTPYTPLDKKIVDTTDDETLTEEWTLDQPVAQTKTTAIVEVKGTVDVVLTPLVAEALDRYIEAMVHRVSTRHPAAIVDDLHTKVLREAVQNSKTTFSENLSPKQDIRGTKTEHPMIGTTNQGQIQTNVTTKQDNVTIKGLQANVSIPKVNLCLLQASVEESPATVPSRSVTHVSLVALCFDRIATQVRMNRGVVEETANNVDAGKTSNFDRYVHASKMQPQSSGSLRSNAGAEKGKEIAAKLNIHRVHGQLRGLDTTDIGTCAITAIPFEKSKVLFTLEELDEFTFVDETDQQAIPDVTRIGPSQEKWGWIMFECGLENLTIKGGRQSGAVLYNSFGIMGKNSVTERGGVLTSNNSSDSPTGSGYNTDVSDDNLPCDRTSPSSDINGNSVSDEQDEGVESDDLKKDLPLMPPPPDSCSMKLTIKEIWFSFAAPTNVRSPAHAFSRQLNLLSTATPAVGAWLVPIDQLKSSLNKLETEGTLRICAVMGCIMTEALENKSVHFPLRSKYNRLTKVARFLQENPSCLLCNILHHYLHQANYSIIDDATMSDGLPALVTLKKGLVALARQWMKFIVVTPAFKGVSLHRPAQPLKPPATVDQEHEEGLGLDNGGGLQSDTSADGAEFEFDAATVSEHTMLLEGTANRPPPGSSGPVTGAEIMRKLSKTHTHSDSALKIKGIHPYHSLSYTSGDTATDSPVHVGRAGMPVKESPRKESLLSYLTGSFPSLHNLLEGTPQRSSAAVKSSSLTRTGNTVATDMLSEHPLLSEPSSVSFYNWMSNAVGNRGSVVQESPVTKSGHNSLPTGVAPNLPTIPSASDFNTVLSSDQNTLDGTHSQHSTSQDDVAGVEEANQGFPAVQLADAQVVFKPLLSHTGIQSQDTMPLCYRMYFGEHLSFSGTLDCLRADIVDSDTAKDRKGKRARRQGHVNLPPLEFKPALMLETFSISAVVMEKSVCTPQNSTSALSFHDLNKRYYNTFHCNFTISCQSISQHVDMALVRLIHQFSTMIDDIKATQTDIKLSRYTAGSASPTPTFKTRKHRDFRSSDFSRSSRGSLNGGNRVNNAKNKRANNENNKKESRNKNSLGRSERRTSKVSRKGSKDVVDHMTIHMDDSDSITVSEQSEPSAECWQNMYKLLNFYSLISDPTGILEKSSETFGPAGVRSPTEPTCRVVFENEQDNNSLTKTQRKRSLVTSEPQHVTLIVFGIGMVNRTHLEADIGGLTMESELKRIHGSFTLKEKMKDVLHQKMTETCATAHIGGVNIVLLEGITPNIQTVVKCSIAKSQALYSAQRGLKTNNAAVFKVGAISINIPQHPATLHSMMVRSSHQLSKQISDLIRQPSTAPQPMKEDIATPLPSEKTPTSVNQTPIETNEFPQLPEGLEKKPIVLKFSAMLDGIAIGAALLPSLKAEYKMGRMRSHGMTGAQTRFTFELPNHRLRFTSKVSATDMSTIPPSASLNLPPVTMSGKYIMEEHDSYSDQVWSIDELPSKQGYYLQGNYLRCVAEVGSFEHNLTTDLLNHLVFVQKVFMKEVNEVIQKVSGGEQPIPLWNEHDGTTDGDKPKILLYSLNLQFKGIQVTATTPSMRAVRFETGLIELELSNRLQTKASPGSSSYLKLFGKCQVDLNLALGQIVKHQVYEEAGSDFHQVAYFKTRIGLRNALREEISGSSDREAVLITLNRPIVYAQPVAFDRAVLFWLNYKAAYDNWNEQRMALHKDIHMATKEVVDMLPGIQQTSAQAFGTLFLQLTVNDLGICLPITNTAQSNHTGDLDTGSALVLTIESTLITACSSESLVSKGHFKNFCIRFADGFETSWDDWKPEIRGDLVMNACVVPDGTYEVCSRTTGQAAAESSSAGTWTLNVLWKMCGIDVHMDPNIGKRLNALGNTLTTLTGEEDIDDIADLNSVNIADLSDEDEVDTMSPTIHTEAVDYRRQGTSSSQPGELRGRKIMKRLVDIRELNEQAKVIDDLKKLGASEGTINQEIQRYQQLESVAVNDIRRDVRKKLRRSSMRAASLKDKWGLGYKPSYSRSKSISASGRPPLKRMERASSRIGETDELPEIRVDAASPGPRVTWRFLSDSDQGFAVGRTERRRSVSPPARVGCKASGSAERRQGRAQAPKAEARAATHSRLQAPEWGRARPGRRRRRRLRQARLRGGAEAGRLAAAMAQCVQSVQELIPDSFVPCVAALCSDEAERLTRLNHLSFSELLKPFSRLTSEVHMRDPNNQLHIIKNLKIAVSNIVTQPPQPGAIGKLLNDVVSGSQPAEGLVANVITAGDYDLNISATTPWFESYRETFLQSMPASDHEFLNHYLACMLVASSGEAEPMEQFSKLSQEQHRIQHNNDYSYPKWFIPNTLKYYVLLHDVTSGDEQRAESIYEEMKQKYGTQGCYLLKINSRAPNRASDEQIPDPWSQYLQKNSIQNQESYEDGPCTMTSSKNSDSNLLSLDGLDNEVKDGLPNNFRIHPLQIDQCGDPPNNTDGSESKSASSVHETKKASTAVIRGACLTLTDHDRIRQFIQEFTFRGLLPHIEKTIRQLNDQLISRKGLSRSLFSATKKWFSGSKVPEKSINELKNTSGLLYPPEAPELQIRKMADLCFLVQHYDLAYSCYHTAKKDFLNDQAMLYAAGALEMAAVSAFLQPGAPRPYPAHYMDTAIQTYRDICKNMVLAERCVLLSAEILKSQSKYSEAAALLIRLTSEDSDLRSALLLEQAAHCFINMKSPMVRKYAFHMILAGHRFSKAGQKKHALRCYCQAMQVYKGKGWSLAEDHINFTIGRQSYTLRQLDNAVSAFRHILINESKQSAAQQGAFLREYLYVYKNVNQLSPDGPLPQLPLPYINSSATRVFFGHDRRPADGEKQAATHISLDQEYDSESSQQWRELEEHVVAVANKGVIPSSFYPTQYCLNSYSDNSRFPLAVVEEPITVEVAFRNPLKVPLLLSDLSLLWKFQPKDASGKDIEKVKERVTGEPEMIGTEVISEFLINSEESKVARLKLFPHHIGELHILGVVYNLGTIQGSGTVDGIGALPGCHTGKHSLSMSVRGRQDLEIQGPRLNNTKEEKTSVKYGPDRRLDPIVTEEMPLLEVFFIHFPTGLLCGEIRKAYVEFVNVSKCPLTGLKVVSKRPEFFTFGGNTAALTPLSPSTSENCSAYKTVVTASPSLGTALVSTASSMDFGTGTGQQLEAIPVPLPDSVLLPGASIQLPMWLRGPDEEGVHEINFLFYYESVKKQPKKRHRILRHTAVICTSRSLNVRATVCRSNSLEDEEGRGGNMLVFVDVENTNTSEAGVKEFHMVQVSSSSKHWQLHKSVNISENKDAKLASREKGKFCFKAVRCKQKEGGIQSSEKYTFADIIFGNEQIISSASPCADFFYRSLSSELKKTQDQLSAYPEKHREATEGAVRLVEKCSEVDLSIVILWKAYVVEDNKQLILEGQHHVVVRTVGKEAFSHSQKEEPPEMELLKFFRPENTTVSTRPSVEQLSNLIKTSLHYPESFHHPFHQKSLCLVPVTLLLSNCSKADVDVIVDLRHKTTSPEALETHGSFTWLGQTQYKLQLKSQEMHSLQLKACFVHTGVYNLGTPRVFAKLSDHVTVFETSQQNSMPALIIINNA